MITEVYFIMENETGVVLVQPFFDRGHADTVCADLNRNYPVGGRYRVVEFRREQ